MGDCPYEVDTVKLQDFELKGKPKPCKRGTIQKCKLDVGHKKRGFMIKKVEKSDENDPAVEGELEAFKSVFHPCIAPLKYYFQDEKNHYLVYDKARGKNLWKRITKLGAIPEDWVKKISDQFVSVIEACEESELHYMRKEIDNIYIDRNLLMTVVGLDCTSENVFAETDATPSKGTSWLSFGNFIFRCIKKEAPGTTIPDDLEDDTKDILRKTLLDPQAERDNLNPRKLTFMRQDFVIEADAKHVKIGDFEVNWEEGVVVTMGGVSVGWKSGLYFKFAPVREAPATEEDDGTHPTWRYFGIPDSFWGEEIDESVELTMGPEGLEVVDNATGTTMNLGGNGLTAENSTEGLKITLGNEGVSLLSDKGGVKVFMNGDFKIDLGENMISMTEGKPDFKVGDPKFEKSLKGGALMVKIGDSFSLFVGNYLRIGFGPAIIKIDPKGVTIGIGPMSVKALASGALIIALGGLSLSISTKGIEISAGCLSATLGPEGFKIDADAFHFGITSEGISASCDYDFDFLEYVKSVPSIQIKIELPPIPGGPSLPAIDLGIPIPPIAGLDLTRKDPEGPAQDVSVFLEGDEKVKAMADCVKTRFLSHKKRKIVLTTKNRLFYCTPTFSHKMGDIEWGPKSSLTPKDDDILVVCNGKGRKYSLKFDDGESERNKWEKMLKPIVAQYTAPKK